MADLENSKYDLEFDVRQKDFVVSCLMIDRRLITDYHTIVYSKCD